MARKDARPFRLIVTYGEPMGLSEFEAWCQRYAEAVLRLELERATPAQGTSQEAPRPDLADGALDP